MKDRISALIKKQYEKFCNFIDEGTFVVMLTILGAGYYAAIAIMRMEYRDFKIVILSTIFSIASFTAGYVLYKTNKEDEKEKKESQKASTK
jgi:hypothetical protein